MGGDSLGSIGLLGGGSLLVALERCRHCRVLPKMMDEHTTSPFGECHVAAELRATLLAERVVCMSWTLKLSKDAIEALTWPRW